jgi:peptide/nickel transport system substrate-binding protein
VTGLPDTGRSRAVLIGTGRYQLLSELGSVHNNLSVLARTLRDAHVWGLPSGNCVVVEDPASTVDILDPIANAAREATDTLLLYYVGHGLVDPRRSELHLAVAG